METQIMHPSKRDQHPLQYRYRHPIIELEGEIIHEVGDDPNAARLAKNERARQHYAGIPTSMQLLILQNAASGAPIDQGWNDEGGGLSTRLQVTKAVRTLQRRGWIMLYKGVYSITMLGQAAYLKGTT